MASLSESTISLESGQSPTHQFLKAGDFITIHYHHFSLFSQGFKSSLLSLSPKQAPSNINNIFIIQTDKASEGRRQFIHYGEQLSFVHLLSGKYLSFTTNSSQDPLKLKSNFTHNCYFTIQSLFKCQSFFDRKIKYDEEISIESSEKLKMCIEMVQNETQMSCCITMKKHQYSVLVLTRNNQEEKAERAISNLEIYQVVNIESEKVLFAEEQGIQRKSSTSVEIHLIPEEQKENQKEITFQKNINQYGSYVMFEKYHPQPTYLRQAIFQFDDQILIKFYGLNQYLCFADTNKPYLSDTANQEAVFIWLDYNEEQLDDGCNLKIQHQKSKKFLSITNNSQCSLDEFRLLNIYRLNRVQFKQMRITLLINQIFSTLKELIQNNQIIKNKQNTKKILQEIVHFTYGSNSSEEEFLLMNTKVKIKIDSTQQQLLASVGFLNLLSNLTKRILQDLKKGVKDSQKTFYQEIMCIMMMIITAICLNNPSNISALCLHLPDFYEGFGIGIGIVQCLFNIFSEDRVALNLLQNLEHHRSKRQKARSIDILLQVISTRKFDLILRRKIVNLLECIVIITATHQKLLFHEESILKYMKANKLRSIMFESRYTKDYQILIAMEGKQEFLQQMVLKKSKYKQELELVVAQMHLSCSVCHSYNMNHFSYFRTIISENVLYNYIRSNIGPDFKLVFLRMLDQIYLHSQNINFSTNILLIHQPKHKTSQKHLQELQYPSELEQESKDSHGIVQSRIVFQTDSKTIEKIKNSVTEIIKKFMKNEVVDHSLFMNIKVFKKLLQLELLENEEVNEFKIILKDFIEKNYLKIKREEQIKVMMIEIFKVMMYYEELQISEISRKFILLLAENVLNITKESSRTQKTIECLEKTLSEQLFFNFQQIERECTYLLKVINFSINQCNPEVFYAGSQLLKAIKDRELIFIKSLKEKIIINGKWTHQLYYKIIVVKQRLIVCLQEYKLTSKSSIQFNSVKNLVVKTMNQINYIFYEFESQIQTKSNKVSPLVQSLMREFRMIGLVVNFIINNQKDLELEETKAIFQPFFEFINVFILQSESNCNSFFKRFTEFKVVFQYADEGQMKILYSIVKDSNIQSIMYKELLDCALVNLKSSREPNPFAALCLIRLLYKKKLQKIDKEELNKFAVILLKDHQLFQNFLKIELIDEQYAFMFQSSDPKASKYHSNFASYLTLTIQCLLLLIEHSQHKAQIVISLKQKVRLEMIIQLLNCSDIIDSMDMNELANSLLKANLIKVLLKVYQEDYRTITTTLKFNSKNTLQMLVNFYQQLNQKLIYCKLDIAGAKELLINEILNLQGNEIGSICYEIIKIQSNNDEIAQQTHLFAKHFSCLYLIIVIYYPFMLKSIENLTLFNSNIRNHDNFIKEFEEISQLIYRKLKDFLQSKLSYGEYEGNKKQFNRAILVCEEALKMKLGFNIDQSYGEQSLEKKGEEETGAFFLNKKASNVVKNFTSSSNKNEALIYESIIRILYSQRVKDFLATRKKLTITNTTDKDYSNKVYQVIRNLVKSSPRYHQNALEMFLIYAEKDQYLLHFTETVDQMEFKMFLATLISHAEQDPRNTTLRQYFITANLLLQSIITTKKPIGANVFKESCKNERELKELMKTRYHFNKRVQKIIEGERQIYRNNNLQQQMDVYCQSIPLNYEQPCENLIIEMVLEWIANKLIVSSNLEKEVITPLILEVIELLKAYVSYLTKFNSKYVTSELDFKIHLCLRIIYFWVSGNNRKAIKTMINRCIWEELNAILKLNDSWQTNLAQVDLSSMDILNEVEGNGSMPKSSCAYLAAIHQVCKNSVSIYGNELLYEEKKFPLLPIKSHFGQIKRSVIDILKEVKHADPLSSNQFFKHLDLKAVKANIEAVYEKHFNLFSSYTVSSIDTDFIYQNHPYRDIARNMCLENGVDLTSIQMFVESTVYHNDSNNQKYSNYRIEFNATKSFISIFSTAWHFFIDFLLLFIVCFRKDFVNSEPSKVKKFQDKIYKFFYSKLGRAQILIENELYSCDFLIRPECVSNRYKEKKFISKINFISVQLKLESIINASQLFDEVYINEQNFYYRFNGFRVIQFLNKYSGVLRVISLILVYINNIILLVNPHDLNDFYKDFIPSEPFEIVLMINFTVTLLFSIIFVVKEVPLIIATSTSKLNRGIDSFKNYAYYNKYVQRLILATKVIFHPVFLYNIAYLTFMCLTFWNKLFISVLVLDLLVQTPTLKTLLMTIWKPKFELILTVLSFLLIQYFFSIITYYFFFNETIQHCENFGKCFAFIFVTTNKLVGGFVGYIYQNSAEITKSKDVSIFELFCDFYLILIYQIFISMVLIIIVDSFHIIRTENSKREENLNISCLICNLNRSLFNASHKASFKGHISIDHNVWMYFFYYHYILHKTSLERNSFERHIYLHFNTDWLPNNYAKSIIEPNSLVET